MALSKEAYLKKYLSRAETTGKKTKKKLKSSHKCSSGLKIVDEDHDIALPNFDAAGSNFEGTKNTSSKKANKAYRQHEEEDEEETDPIVVLVGNKVEELKMIGKFKTSNWKSLEDEEAPSQSNLLGRTNRTRHDSESDQSVDARSTGSRDQSPVRRREVPSPSNVGRQRHGSASSSDLSVKRRRSQIDDDSDLSPKTGRVERKSDRSPSSRNENVSTNQDSRRSVHRPDFDAALSPKRAGAKRELPDCSTAEASKKPPNHRRGDAKGDSSPKRGRVKSEPLDGVRRRERRGLAVALTGHESGADATAPVKRQDQYDKRKRGGKTKPRELTEEERLRVEEMKKKYGVWNKGIKQVQERAEKLKEMACTIEKPLARYRDDVDLDEHLKEQLFDEDPMLAYMKKKRPINAAASNKIDKPKYRGQAPANRYGILPGYRWDGVDRSNGFETKLLSQANVKKAEQDEYYAWSSGRFE